MRRLGLALLAGTVSCTVVDDPGLPNDCVDGPEIIPLNCTTDTVPLTSGTVPDWLGALMCSGSDRIPEFQSQLDAAQGDAAVLDAFFAIVDATWTFDGTTASCTNALDTEFALLAIGALRDPSAFVRLDALVWRPLPTPTFQLEFDEYTTGEAIACIPTPEAQAEAQNIAANHPDALVRLLTADRIQSQKCGIADF